jgi:predicted house-cleaning noncanonical NTP pyrophosphatase (MazG superfamily)
VDKSLKFIEEMSVNMPIVDFTKFDLNQLRQLSRELSDTIEQKTEEEREKAAAEIKRIASALGMTVEEILAGKKGKRGRKTKAKEGVSISPSPEPLGEEPASIEAPVEAPVVKSIEQEEEKQKKEKRKPTKR